MAVLAQYSKPETLPWANTPAAGAAGGLPPQLPDRLFPSVEIGIALSALVLGAMIVLALGWLTRG